MAQSLVVGTLIGQTSLSSQIKRASSAFVDVIEVRLDTFPNLVSPQDLLQKIQRATRKPLLLTFRSHTECGIAVPKKKRLSDAQRIKILTPLLPLVDMLDVEIRHFSFSKNMTRLAHQKKVRVIHSYHQFQGRFQANDAMLWSRRALQLKGDVFKVAMTPKTNEELEDFLSWGLDLKNPQKILIGMGKVGEISRYLGTSFGSCMTYGHLGTSAAPGQVPVSILGKAVRKLYGLSS